MILGLVEEPEIGRIYTGKVSRIEPYGAFVEFMPGRDGMVHISQIADYRVERIEDEVKLGDEIMVMVTNIDPQGKVRLSRQAVLEGWTAEEARERDSGGQRSGGGGNRRSGAVVAVTAAAGAMAAAGMVGAAAETGGATRR
jgi:polyribonucleotide nucleotidyltransferase